MVDNVTRFVPRVGAPEFRTEVRAFAPAKSGGAHDDYFQLDHAWKERSRIRALIDSIRANERAMVRGMLGRIEPYRPETGPLAISVYFVAGGVSDGFAFENDSFYANLARAGGDYNGVIENAVHEAYHVLQIAAQRRAGRNPAWVSDESVPPVDRLLTGTLVEGTANYVADPTAYRPSGRTWSAPASATGAMPSRRGSPRTSRSSKRC
jgi:hypothetical protein